MDARAYLASRSPEPPEALSRWMDGVPLDGVAPLEGLGRTALEALGRARGAPGRVRESAFQLLAADALLTWACEAALEEDAPDEALRALLDRTVEKG